MYEHGVFVCGRDIRHRGRERRGKRGKEGRKEIGKGREVGGGGGWRGERRKPRAERVHFTSLVYATPYTAATSLAMETTKEKCLHKTQLINAPSNHVTLT